MWLSLLVIAAVVLIAFVQSTHGFFSALIMMALTICCAGLAFGLYEWVAVVGIAPLWIGGRNLSYSLALASCFGIPLIVLRLVFDRVVTRSPLLPVWIDRAGGGLCGLITGLITAGTMGIALTWLPLGPAVLGFSRISLSSVVAADGSGGRSKIQDDRVNDMLFKPDRFAVGIASVLSDGVFSGDRQLSRDPDLIQATGWVSAVDAEVSRFAPPKSISIVATETVQFLHKQLAAPTPAGGRTRGEQPVAEETKYESIAPEQGMEFRMVRVALKREAEDAKKNHFFSLRQFRLVGQFSDDSPAKQYYAVATLQPKPKLDGGDDAIRYIAFRKQEGVDWPIANDTLTPPSGGDDKNQDQVDIVFQIPQGFTPDYLEYKRGARVALDVSSTAKRPLRETDDSVVPPDAIPPDTSGSAIAPGAGGARRYAVRKGRSFFGPDLPLELKNYRQESNAEVRDATIIGGKFNGWVDEQETGKSNPARKFQVPQDKRLLHLNTGYIQAKSGLGRALSFAVGVAQSYTVTDDKGTRYEMIGKYAVADVDSRQAFEFQYFPESSGSIGGTGPFNRIRDLHLKGEYEFVLLFLVEPGVKITEFSTGSQATAGENLASENLVAPN